MSVVGYTIFKIYYLESNIDAWFTIGTLKLLASKWRIPIIALGFKLYYIANSNN